jgi:hypothetical protein
VSVNKSQVAVLLALAAFAVFVLRQPIAGGTEIVGAKILGPLDAGGNLKVHEQGIATTKVAGQVAVNVAGPLDGKALAVHEQGTVPTILAIPARQFSSDGGVGTNATSPGWQVSGDDPDPAGTSYAITSVIASAPVKAASAQIVVEYGSMAHCGAALDRHATVLSGLNVVVPAGDTVEMEFPQPYVIPPQVGEGSCLVALRAGDAISLTVVGYRF